MRQFKAIFLFNGRRLETIIQAPNPFDGRALIEAQYANGKFQMLSFTEIK